VLDDHDLAGLLRPGMSAEPTVDTKATVLAARKTDEDRKVASQEARGGQGS
jgi:membrane fusion protein (multidrug efflux system)